MSEKFKNEKHSFLLLAFLAVLLAQMNVAAADSICRRTMGACLSLDRYFKHEKRQADGLVERNIHRRIKRADLWDTSALVLFSNRAINYERLSEKNYVEAFSDRVIADYFAGVVMVTIPDPSTRMRGDQSFSAGGSNDPHYKFRMMSVRWSQQEDDIFAVTMQLNGINKWPERTILYVHGIRNTVPEAAESLALLATDLPTNQALVLVTWPSYERRLLTPTNYRRMRRNATQSHALLASAFSFLESNGIKNISVVAHSMGGELVAPPMSHLQEVYRGEVKTAATIFVASDLSRRDFNMYFRQNIIASSRRVVIYCSYSDKALMASRWINGESRLGQCEPNKADDAEEVHVEGALGTNEWRQHGWLFREGRVMDDIHGVIETSASASERQLPRHNGHWSILIEKDTRIGDLPGP